MYSNLINLKSLRAIDNTSDVLEFRALLVNSSWYGVRNGNKFLINIPDNIASINPYVFSTEANDYWKEVGTAKKREKLHLDDALTRLYWSPFRKGMIVKGIVVNNQIEVSWKLQIKIAKKEYERQSSARARKVTNSNSRPDEVSSSEEAST